MGNEPVSIICKACLLKKRRQTNKKKKKIKQEEEEELLFSIKLLGFLQNL